MPAALPLRSQALICQPGFADHWQSLRDAFGIAALLSLLLLASPRQVRPLTWRWMFRSPSSSAWSGVAPRASHFAHRVDDRTKHTVTDLTERFVHPACPLHLHGRAFRQGCHVLLPPCLLSNHTVIDRCRESRRWFCPRHSLIEASHHLLASGIAGDGVTFR